MRYRRAQKGFAIKTFRPLNSRLYTEQAKGAFFPKPFGYKSFFLGTLGSIVGLARLAIKKGGGERKTEERKTIGQSDRQ